MNQMRQQIKLISKWRPFVLQALQICRVPDFALQAFFFSFVGAPG